MSSIGGKAVAAWRLASYVVKHPFNKGHELDALWRVLRWQVGSRVLGAPVVAEWVNGSKLVVAPGMTGATGNLYTGLHEYADMAFVLHYLRAGDLFVDVGANVGSYTVLAAAVSHAHVVSCEPLPATYARLLTNIRVNGCDDAVEALNTALGAEPGELVFTADLDTVNHVLGPGEQATHTARVPVTTLDRVLRGRVPALIKIDVEGFESQVLDGGADALSSAGALLIELNGSGERYNISDRDLSGRLQSAGLGCYRYDPAARKLQPADPLRVQGGNALFLRDVNAVNERIAVAPSFRVFGRAI